MLAGVDVILHLLAVLGGDKLDPAKRREIAESVISGRKTGAEMARLYNVGAPTVSRIVAAYRTGLA